MTPNLAARPSGNPNPAPAPRNRGFWPMRDIPTLAWLLLTVAAALAQGVLPMPRWLMIHLLLLGAVTHAILVWSQYFSFALLRSRATDSDRRTQTMRLILSNAGAVLVIAGVSLHVWPVTLAGAVSLVVAVIWHGASLIRRSCRSMTGRFGRTLRYYVASAALLTIGVGLGAWLARGGVGDDIVLAHAFLNVLGWIGLTVAGTIVTLWPTILRTRADEHATTGAARALPMMAGGVLVAAAGAAFGQSIIVALGLFAYLAGLVVIGLSLVRAARRKAPRSFAALSVGMALAWWAGAVATIAVGAVIVSASGAAFSALAGLVDRTVPFLAAGFAAQVVVGALSYLIPVVLGGGPRPVRAGTTAFDAAGPLRVTVANAALAVCALPVSNLVRGVSAALYLIAMASFLFVMLRAMRAQRLAKASKAMPGPDRIPVVDAGSGGPIIPGGERPRRRRVGQAIAGLLAVLLVVAGAAALGRGTATTANQDAPVKTVHVEAANMRFTPNRIEVPVGTRLVIRITNTDKQLMHDLVLANGATSEHLLPGQSGTIDAGVITADIDGWCSISDHRQMGMTLRIVATSASASPEP
ncbi:cupredoxin domain-containing protein [Microbacterium sp. 22195]|uniref:cupredoxin domain-containing protein n=1 Tax=Microbacterium sp. 22195 TaxID=3453891 RepID=UPI003F853C12